MSLHVNAGPAEVDTFHLQAESLLGTAFAGELDGSAGTDDALPRQAGDVAENANNLTSRAGPACGCSDRTVGGNGAFGQGANDAHDLLAQIGRGVLAALVIRAFLGHHAVAVGNPTSFPVLLADGMGLFCQTRDRLSCRDSSRQQTLHVNLGAPIQKFTQAGETSVYDGCIARDARLRGALANCVEPRGAKAPILSGSRAARLSRTVSKHIFETRFTLLNCIPENSYASWN
jgi:hypothetical protein